MQKVPPLTPEDTQGLLVPILSPTNARSSKRAGNVDFGFAIDDVGRFRFNVFQQRGSLAAAIRKVNLRSPATNSWACRRR